MEEAQRAREYLSRGRLREAGSLLDRMLIKERGNDELWYLRGVVMLKLKKYDAAQEYFERALSIRRRAEYYRIQGMAHLELFEMDDAIQSFDLALSMDQKDILSRFFLGICFMIMDDPRSVDNLRAAISLDSKRARYLLTNFYSMMFEKDKGIDDAQKRKMVERIKSI
jgi:Tfp pilus assembly protein PilF